MKHQTAEHLTHPKYRADIDGLRAIAVLSVVGFHAFPSLIAGGFFGVDIFFVISGFLISTIILSNLERGTFSFIEFYIRRIRRIFPALLVVLAASFCVGWFVLLPDEYKQLGKHIAGGAGFISNYLFWAESGYFDNASETKPMLHLWSLGIEEQFYIIWPLLLWVLWKKRFNLLTVIFATTLISFALNIDLVIHHAKAAFYSPPTRFWELSMGSVLAYTKLHSQTFLSGLWHRIVTIGKQVIHVQTPAGSGKLNSNFQSFLGILLLSISVLLLSREHSIPGWWALFPTLGTVLIISAGAQAWPNRIILSNRILVWFGWISFPLYLWHWPLLSFARIVKLESLSTEIKIAAIFMSVVLAWLTYRLIEKPIRFGGYRNAKTSILLALMIVTGLVGYNTYSRDGLGFRLNKDQEDYSAYFENSRPEEKYFTQTNRGKYYRDECNFYDVEKSRIGQATQVPRNKIDSSCYERSAKYSDAVFIWGDSHAQQLYIGLKHNLPPNWQILQVASSGCAPNIHALHPSRVDQCTQSNWFALKTIRDTKPQVVIVAQSVGHNINTVNQIAATLKSLGVPKVIFTGPTPHWTADLPKIILRRLWENTPQRTYNGIEQQTLSENSTLQKKFKQTDTDIFVNIIDLFCNKDGCLTYLGHDKKTGITSWDYGHLTEIASDYLSKELLAKLIVSNNSKSLLVRQMPYIADQPKNTFPATGDTNTEVNSTISPQLQQTQQDGKRQ
jgi:hypothetical protein